MSYKRILASILLPFFFLGCAGVNRNHQYTLPQKVSLINTCDEARKNFTTAKRNYSKFSEAYSEIFPLIEKNEKVVLEAMETSSMPRKKFIEKLTNLEEKRITWKSLDYFFLTQVELYSLKFEELCKD